MKVVVKSFAGLKDILGPEALVDLEEKATIRDLLGTLCASHPSLSEFVFDSEGNLSADVTILKNRTGLDPKEGMEALLKEGDEVAFLPPFSGG